MITLRTAPIEPQNNDDIHTLFTNIDLILANSEKILQNEEYRNICIKGTGIDGMWFLGHITLFLGDFITLWSNGSPWRNEQKFYYHLGGSPLSGMSFCTYWQDGEIGCDRDKPRFGELWWPSIAVTENRDEQGNVIEPAHSRKKSKLSINDLLQALQAKE